ncbi:MAG TPA: AIR synthase-related protein, partial [Gemmatimonadaceae bacterium]|nr:AIR synthase-related protein [Gemmatimonadaceae bacterium]
ASLELITSGHIVAIQDMGAAGLTSSSAEMAARGDVGVTIDVTKMPVRETGMTPYEILLSESQERMLVVAKRGRERQVEEILAKWDLAAAVIGEVIAEPVYRVTEGSRVVAEFPGSELVSSCPFYTPNAREDDTIRALRARDLSGLEDPDPADVLTRLLAAPTIASKRWVTRQYDTSVQTNTVLGPGGGDAAVVRIRDTDRALAIKTDGNGRYTYLDPRMGGRIAVAEAARNVACVGGRPMAITNCLNFGNPTRPEVYYQLREAIAGMGEACRALGTPVTGGNVSLYNENPGGAIYPTPVVGMIGIVDPVTNATPSTFGCLEDAIVLFGEPTAELGGSEYLATIHGLVAGAPPACDLEAERKLIDAVLDAIGRGIVRSAHDVSDGGLAVALAECCVADIEALKGAELDLGPWAKLPRNALLFGEGQGRVVISTPDPAAVLAVAGAHGVPAKRIGTVRAKTAGFRINAMLIEVEKLAQAFHDAIPSIMSGSAAAVAVAEEPLTTV